MTSSATSPEKARPTPIKPKSQFKPKLRKALLLIHLWTGLILGLWFAVMGLTGSVMAWRHEIRAFEWRSCFPAPAPPTDAGMIPISKAIEIAKQSFPDMPERALSSIRVPRADLPYYVFPMGQVEGKFHIAAVDPYSGAAYPPKPVPEVFHFFEELHMQLMLGDNGNTAIGIFSFFTLFLLISGLWLWWPNQIKQLKVKLSVKWGASKPRLWLDLHNVMGVYLFPILILTTLTAVQMVGSNIIGRMESPARGEGAGRAAGQNAPAGAGNQGRPGGGRRAEGGGRAEGNRSGQPTGNRGAAPNGAPAAAPQGRGRQRGPQVEPTGTALPIDQLYKVAVDNTPGMEMVEVSLPQRDTQPLRVMFRRNIGLTKYGQIYVNPYNAQVIERTPMYNEQGGSAVSELSRGLHYGTFGGALSKLLYSLTGLMPLGLFITGVLMWWRKKRNRMERARTKAA